MLSRVASHLYWMSRYQERAENMARILDVGQSLALLSAQDDGAAIEPLIITDTLVAFDEAGGPRTTEGVARFLAWDAAHPSSIANCLESSRENARAVRGAITSEMWETINDTWLQLQQRRRVEGQPVDAGFFDWVKERSHQFRGVTSGTILRGQPWAFIRLGTIIERADNTARILSVKQGAVDTAVRPTPPADDIADYYSLAAVLRSVSAFEAYQDTYRDVIDARRVAELLILDPKLPRSLRFCYDEIEALLDQLPKQAGRPARRLAATIQAGLAHGDVAEALSLGLYEFLERFLKENVLLGEAVQSAYLELT
ncbi:alpha-E domain-containing protein [Quisquiliibacterium transsilvanicum]|uniref:Putative alpha-E superfamily protein n=1 Tax=Quisquiliibacterium transsilvanicum TaxID=1549638 RepID=A0A7W8HGT2_9BURK|nr:alpha-E domain-containing protein [Quisquiliibacterium transsilvanicum]MBB5270960.1 putative alpha-E superfamily protein [Quisquiliibacterium transsilvanicum]